MRSGTYRQSPLETARVIRKEIGKSCSPCSCVVSFIAGGNASKLTSKSRTPQTDHSLVVRMLPTEHTQKDDERYIPVREVMDVYHCVRHRMERQRSHGIEI